MRAVCAPRVSLCEMRALRVRHHANFARSDFEYANKAQQIDPSAMRLDVTDAEEKKRLLCAIVGVDETTPLPPTLKSRALAQCAGSAAAAAVGFAIKKHVLSGVTCQAAAAMLAGKRGRGSVIDG